MNNSGGTLKCHRFFREGGGLNVAQAEIENASHLSQTSTVCTLRLHISQVLVEVLELLHGGPEGHDLAGGVRRGTHLCSRHPAASQDPTWKNENIYKIKHI